MKGGGPSAGSAEPPRVLLLLRADGVGGAERAMANLVLVLEREGIVCELVTLRPPRFGPGPLAAHGPTVLDFPAPLSQVQRWRQLSWLRAAVRSGRYRRVVAFGPVPNALAALAKPRGGPLTVLSERGDPYIGRRRRWNRWFMWTYRRADVVVVPTQQLATELERESRRPREVRVIPNSLAADARIVTRDGPRRPTIGAVGRFVASKRFGDLVEAFHQAGAAELGWTLELVGDGPERPRLEALVRARSLAGRVRFAGLHPAPWEVLARADIFVLCSEHEGFPNVLLEAIASGCAVVASDCRFGPREIVEDGVSGILYPPGDVPRLAAILRELVADPDRRDALGRAATLRARAFTVDAVGPRWLELLA